MRIDRTPENTEHVVAILGQPRTDHKTTILDDGHARRINGRYIVGNVPVVDEYNNLVINKAHDLVTRRQRFRIPKQHPWRGERP